MSQRKILLADDSITIQKVVNLTFADEGIEVLTVGDGDAAMEKIIEFKPDLILADVNMPGLSGYQICEKIKQSEDFSKTPVILLVGSFEPFDEQEAQRVGADDYLTKPFQSIRQLVGKVTELLDSDRKITGFHAAEPEEFAADSENHASELSSNFSRFDDSGFDDEMIQTNQPGGFAFDESPKFETKAEADFLENNNSSEPAPSENTETIEQPISSHPATDLGFDDNFSLELPPVEGEEEPAEKAKSPDSTVTENEPNENQSAENAAQTETGAADRSEHSEAVVESPPISEQASNAASFVAASQLSPETIDIIVQKVIERLADKTIREIAWEVVPQMTDLIVKKLAEENMKK